MASLVLSGTRRWDSTWNGLPAEIRYLILDALVQVPGGCSLSRLATVSREWQIKIEKHNFSQIKLTPSCLVDFGTMIYRNRSLVDYIWFCLELDGYDCSECAPRSHDEENFPSIDETLHGPITKAFQDLFGVLSTWEPNGEMVLDISIYSPSDSKHWFKYISILPDSCSGKVDYQFTRRENDMQHQADDDSQHGWAAGRRISPLPETAIAKVFWDIMVPGPFDSEELEQQWYDSLPLVPVVTSVLLRQQNRRRWKPASLAHLFARFPRLQELHYEPWREWDGMQQFTDSRYRLLFESIARNNKLKKMVLFENFNQEYPIITMDEMLRSPAPAVSRIVATTSLELEHLSASFIVDASQFFALEASSRWPDLTSLALTSRSLVPGESTTRIVAMLQAAAAAATKMPQLKTMEIWNGRKGLAALFRYQAIEETRQATITWKNTWKLTLPPPVLRDWETAAVRLGSHRLDLVEEWLDRASIQSHADAIHHLRLNKVLRPVSLQQIRMEREVLE